jgi:hypothetical protein
LLLIRPFLAFSEVRHPLWHCTVFIQVLNGRINNFGIASAVAALGLPWLADAMPSKTKRANQ